MLAKNVDSFCNQNIDSYALSKRDDDHYSDYWLRTHAKNGAKVLTTCGSSHTYYISLSNFAKAIENRSVVLFKTYFDSIIFEYKNRFYYARLHDTHYIVNVPCVWVTY